jgi:hypothetical protein
MGINCGIDDEYINNWADRMVSFVAVDICSLIIKFYDQNSYFI